MDDFSKLNHDLLSAETKWGNKPIPRVMLEPADLVLAAECGRLVYKWWLSKKERFQARQSWANTESTQISGKICEFSVAKWLSVVGVIGDYLEWCEKFYEDLLRDPGLAFSESADLKVKLPCFSREVTIDVKSWRRRYWNHPSSPGVLSVDQIKRHTGKIDLYIATRPYTDTDLTYIKRESEIGPIPVDIMFWTTLFQINMNMQPWWDTRTIKEHGKLAPHCITPSRIWYPMHKLLLPVEKDIDSLEYYNPVNMNIIELCVKGWESVNGTKWIGNDNGSCLSNP